MPVVVTECVGSDPVFSGVGRPLAWLRGNVRGGDGGYQEGIEACCGGQEPTPSRGWRGRV